MSPIEVRSDGNGDPRTRLCLHRERTHFADRLNTAFWKVSR